MHSTDPRPLTLGGLAVPETVSHLGCTETVVCRLADNLTNMGRCFQMSWEKDKKGFVEPGLSLVQGRSADPTAYF